MGGYAKAAIRAFQFTGASTDLTASYPKRAATPAQTWHDTRPKLRCSDTTLANFPYEMRYSPGENAV
jgi:hypothetical protein